MGEETVQEEKTIMSPNIVEQNNNSLKENESKEENRSDDVGLERENIDSIITKENVPSSDNMVANVTDEMVATTDKTELVNNKIRENNQETVEKISSMEKEEISVMKENNNITNPESTVKIKNGKLKESEKSGEKYSCDLEMEQTNDNNDSTKKAGGIVEDTVETQNFNDETKGGAADSLEGSKGEIEEISKVSKDMEKMTT